MRSSRCTWLAFGLLLAASATPGFFAARAETDFTTPVADNTANSDTPSGALSVGAQPEFKSSAETACPHPGALGVSRVVEIDTTTGPEFGDQYLKTETKFLEPGEVVLTFDDGPMRRYTIPILNALDEECVKATFFSVGRMAIADPATLQEVARRGHTIGSHTWSHKKLSSLNSPAMKREVELGLSAVAAAAGTPIAPFFRFPYLGHGRTSLDYIRSRGLGIFGIHVDSNDFRTRNPGVVLKNGMTQLAREKKGIILFHDIQPSTAGALSSLLAELKANGFKIVHMVAKHPPVTLPEYDAIADKALRAKSVAAANTPLADRAATWPISTPDAAGAPAAAASAGKPTAPKKPAASTPAAKPFDWANPSNDPWQLRALGN